MKVPHRRKKTELAVQMLRLLADELLSRQILVLADNGFANRKVIARLPKNMSLLYRGVMDARIYSR